MADNIGKRAVALVLGFVFAAVVAVCAFALVDLLFRLFPAWDLGSMPWWLPMIVLPEMIFIVAAVGFWRKRRPTAVGILWRSRWSLILSFTSQPTEAGNEEEHMVLNPVAADSLRCSVTPWLSVRDSARAVDFYKSAFGATEVYRLDGPGGSVVARLSVDGAEFWLGDESPEHRNFSPESLGGGSVRMILTVQDPDTVFLQALKAGASKVYDVNEGHGWRVGRVVDPFGHHWEIGRPLVT